MCESCGCGWKMSPIMKQAAENGAIGHGIEIRESHAFRGEEVYKNMKQKMRHEATESEFEKKMELE